MFVFSAFADEISPDVDVQIRELNRHGIGYVEFRSADEKNVLDYAPEQLRKIAARFRAGGIGVSAIGSPVGKLPVTTPYEACMDQVKKGLEAAAAMGTRNVRVFSYYVESGVDSRSEVMKRMEGMAFLAQQADIELLLEDEIGLYGENAAGCLDVLTTVGAPNLNLTFDPSNFVQCHQDVMQAYALLKPYIKYLHLKDSVWLGHHGEKSMDFRDAGDVHRLLGQGHGEIREWSEALKQDEYDGFASLEPHLAHVATIPGTGVEKFAFAVEAAKKYFA